EMQMAITFLCWGYEPLWTIDEGLDYPRLVWENKPGELITVPSDLYGGGSGEPDDPYLIYTAQQLNTIGLHSCHLDKHFKLMADVDLSGLTGNSFNCIGIDYRNPFSGVFEGNGHTISYFTYTSTGGYYVGLFMYVGGANAEIKNLGLIDPNVDAGIEYYVGSLVGWLDNGTITNCYTEGGSVDGFRYVGGLMGRNSSGTITNSYSTASVSGDRYIGGLMGRNSSGKITNCYSSASVSGVRYTGGLMGRDSSGKITNCYSSGIVSGDEDVGGLAGYNYRSIIANSYSSASVSGITNVGGFMGRNRQGTITNCYSKGGVSGITDVGGFIGDDNSGSYTRSFWDNTVNSGLPGIGNASDPNVIGESTANMQTQTTFTDAGWDFLGETANGIEDIWFIPQQDYPHLWWEGMHVSMKLTPRKLNCRSQGTWVKAHLTLPQGLTVEDVDSNRPVVLHSFGIESAPLYVFVNKDKLVQIETAFERQVLCSLAGDWPQELTVAGFLADGNIFLGTSNVRINHPGMNVIEELAWYWLNEDCVHPDFCDGIDMNRDSLVNLLDYALLMNIEVEFVTDE
ncbi:MAG: GLUG motif-containing protein, partial [Planctomycetota bacterium]